MIRKWLKMTTNNLTEQWKKGELPTGYYYAEDGGEELIIHIQGQNGSVMGDDFDLKATDWIKSIAPVPSYEQWQPFTDPYFRGLTTKDISELAKKSIRLTAQHCEDNDEILKLKALLCQCEAELGLLEKKTPYIEDIIEEIKEVLK